MSTSQTIDTPQNARSAPTKKFLSFRIEENEFSVDIMSVREIRGWTTTTTLPHAPEYVRGVINLRGTVLPVIDLACRLGLAAEAPVDRDVIIVVAEGGRTMGLRVTAVSDILALTDEQMQPPPDINADRAPPFVRALTILDDRMVRILDLSHVLPTPEDIAA